MNNELEKHYIELYNEMFVETARAFLHYAIDPGLNRVFYHLAVDKVLDEEGMNRVELMLDMYGTPYQIWNNYCTREHKTNRELYKDIINEVVHTENVFDTLAGQAMWNVYKDLFHKFLPVSKVTVPCEPMYDDDNAIVDFCSDRRWLIIRLANENRDNMDAWDEMSDSLLEYVKKNGECEAVIEYDNGKYTFQVVDKNR